ncbi:MAG: flagellar motor protein MotB, partial [Mesorhizobium sp.]
MKCQPRILAGTALGLLMASTPLAALPLPGGTAGTAEQRPPLLLAQAECQEGESAKDCAVRLRTPQAEQPAAPAENAAPSEEQAAPAEP